MRTIGIDPVSLAIGSTIIGGIGTATQVAGTISAGNAAKNAADYNATVARQNAEVAKQNATWAGQEGEATAEKYGLKNRQQMGAIKTGQAASGIKIGAGGSAGDVQESQAKVNALDLETIRSNAARRAYGYQTEAANQEAEAKLQTAAGKNAKKSSYIGAGSSLLGGAAKIGTGYASYQKAGSGLGTAPGDIFGEESFDILE